MNAGAIATRLGRVGLPVLVAACMSACGGGGGGGSSVVPGGGPSGTPATPTPSPTPPATTQASGRAVDAGSGAGLGGYSIAIGAVGTVPQPVGTTAPDGSFTVTSPTTGNVMVQVAPPSGSAFATYHAKATLSAGANALPSVKISALSTEEQNEIALINGDRVAHGVGVLVPDEFAMEVARFHAADMAGLTGLGAPYFSHTDRNGNTEGPRYAAAGGLGGTLEDICANVGPYSGCEAQYVSEGPPAAGAPPNHYAALFKASAVWVGVGAANAGPGQSTYYDEEFVTYP